MTISGKARHMILRPFITTPMKCYMSTTHSLPYIWDKADKINIKILPEKPHIAPGEKRIDMFTKKTLKYSEFERIYSLFADSVWESSKRV